MLRPLLRLLYLLRPFRPIAEYILSFDDYVTGLALGDCIRVDADQMVAFVTKESFADDDADDLFVAIRSALGMYDPPPAHGIKDIPASLLAYCLVALVIRKNLVSLVRVLYVY